MKNIVKIPVRPFVVAATLFLAMTSFPQKPKDLPTAASVDLGRYAGRWYEIAKYPNKFQKQCVANITATYSKKPDGRLQVVNECLKSNGTKDSVTGEAKIVKGSNNAKLKVRFAPGLVSFISAGWGDYWIIDLGPDYEYAVVGEPKREYLWILSRKSEMDEATYQRVLRKVESLGFTPSRLERTRQNANALKGTVTGNRILERHRHKDAAGQSPSGASSDSATPHL